MLPELVALMLPLAIDTRYNSIEGEYYWVHEAYHELAQRGDAAAPLLQRLLLVKRFESFPGVTVDAPWHALMTLAELAPEHQPSEALLLRWLVWSPVCEIKKHAATSLRKIGRDNGLVLPVLALSAGMTGGCEDNAFWALRHMGPSHAGAAPHLEAMLTHPLDRVRKYAAEHLGRHLNLALPLGRDALPTDQAVALLRRHLAGGEVPLAPVAGPGHRADVVSTMFDLQRGQLLTADAWGALQRWSLDHAGDPEPIAAPVPIDGWIHAIARSADGRTLAVVDRDHRLIVFRPGEPDHQPAVHRLPFLGPMHWTPDGRHLLIVQNVAVHAINPDTGEVVRRFVGHRPEINDLALDPQRRRVASGDEDGRIYLWQLDTGEPLHHFRAHGRDISSLAFLDDGRLVSRSWDASVRVWDAATGTELQRFAVRPGTELHSSDVSVEHGLVAAGDNEGRLYLWDLRTGEHLHTRRVGTHRLQRCAFDAAGQLWTISFDGMPRRWQPRTAELLEERSLRVVQPRPLREARDPSRGPSVDPGCPCPGQAPLVDRLQAASASLP